MQLQELDSVLSKQNLITLIKRYFITDENFNNDLNNTIVNGQLNNKSPEEKIDFLKCYVLGNIAREYILKMFVLQYSLKLMIDSRSYALDPYWEDKIKNNFKLLCCDDNSNKPV